MKTNGDDTITAIEANALGHVGLTKREHFAALAMQGLLAGTSGQEALAHIHPSNWAQSAVEAADALIAQLNKNKGEV